VELGHEPLVKHVANVVSEVAEEIVISVAKGRRELYSEILGDGFRYIEDEQSGIGPLEGLVQGMETARGDYVLVSPCDTPFLRKGVCEAIARAAKGKDAAVPMTGKHYLEPLHGTYRRSRSAEAFKRVLSEGGRAPTEAYEYLDVTFMDEDLVRSLDPGLLSFWNINSPEDLRRAEAQLALLR
jgi:molybdopterin-guanine dinucleotide biosynthesis protein A